MRARLFLVILPILVAPAIASAYPQFQLSTGNTRCNQCHFSPVGGGLINNYGRDEAGDTISSGGNGRFLHGLWEPPNWLALGGNFRFAGIIDDNSPRATEYELFPMQGELYVRAHYEGFSIYLDGGVRGAERPVDPSFASLLISPEHYVMWQQGPTGWYVRAGRFYAPYGLRLAEHTAYIRRFLGFNLLEETYNLSGGYIGESWELHLTAFIPDFIRDAVGERGSGAAAYFERREGSTLAWGAQTRVVDGDDDTRVMGGLVGKAYFADPHIQLLAEVDLVHQSFKGLDASRWQTTAYLGASWLPIRGWLFQLQLERWDEDMAIKGVAKDAVGAEIQWFPIAHVEVSAYGRWTVIGSGSDDGTENEMVLLQVHYYL